MPDLSAEHVRNLQDEPVGSLLWRLSLPATVGMLIMASYNIIDSIFVGHFVGVGAIAGLAIVFPVQMLVMAVCQTVGVGAGVLVSMELGRNRPEQAARALGHVFAFTAAFGILFTAFVLAAADPLLQAFGAAGSTLPPARTYLLSMTLGYWPFGASVALSNLARAEGNANLAMFNLIFTAIVNIVLDFLFIAVLGWGIAGAGWATVAANWCSFLFLVGYFRSRHAFVKLQVRHVTLEKSLLADILRLGSSVFARNAASLLLAVLVNNVLSRVGSGLHIAINGIQHRLVMFLFMPMFGLAQGLQPVLGYHAGAQNPHKVRCALQLAFRAAAVLAAGAFVVLQLAPEPLIRIFSTAPTLVREGALVLRIISLGLPLVGYHIVSVTMFQSLGRARPAFILSLTRQVFFFIPLVLVLPAFWGAWGVWIAYPIADFCAFAVTAALTVPQMRRLQGNNVNPAAAAEL